jgi:ATP-dependent RNA helicase SUPV3L1/SUV3
LRAPHLAYPCARALSPRRVTFHAGPTNSGKTFGALSALFDAVKRGHGGTYCAPLRLLAWEAYERAIAAGVPRAALVTGQEREETLAGVGARALPPLTACTVEMFSPEEPMDTVVIDEIQLLGDESRGWAWTRAFLAAAAPTIHVCGDPAALPVLQRLVALTGDELAVARYPRRLSPLRVAGEALPDLCGAVRRGDCVVAFSRRELFSIKADIERGTGLRCGIIFGSLPPMVRRAQARGFNGGADGEGGGGRAFDVLVASDAVGMGLNLAIQRVIFSALQKYDGRHTRALLPAEVKQIGGRAGRGADPGEVVALGGRREAAALAKAMGAPSAPLRTAGLQPSVEQLEAFSRAVEAARRGGGGSGGPQKPPLPFSFVLLLFCELAGPALRGEGAPFFLSASLLEAAAVAAVIDHVPLRFRDRAAFCAAPVDVGEVGAARALRRFAAAFAAGRPVPLGVAMPCRPPGCPNELLQLERLVRVAELYVWLAQRLGGGAFCEAPGAVAAAAELQELISEGLSRLGAEAVRAARARARLVRRGARGGRNAHAEEKEEGGGGFVTARF